MAAKSIIFLLAFVLLVTLMDSSVEGVAPTQAPVPAYTPSYSSPLPYGFGTVCTAMCHVRCEKLTRPYRDCQRTCTKCCALNRCVPNFYEKCGCTWGTVTMYGAIRKCP